MNKGQKIGLGLNVLGLVLFIVWFIVRNSIPTLVSILFAVIFLALLVTSLIVIARATRFTAKDDESTQIDKKI